MTTPLLENIRNQPHALAAVAEYQSGAGRAALERAAELIRGKKRLVLSGMGASLFACQGLPYEVAGSGIDAVAIETAELLYFKPTVIDDDTAVVLVSRSGESVEVTKLLPLVREQGAAVVGVVNVAGSALAEKADVALVIGSPADQMVAVQTYTGTVALMGFLGAALEAELETAHQELDAAIAHLGQILTHGIEAREGWDPLLNTSAPLYILGRGAALGSVNEGVLLMHETAKAPAVGMSVAQFRHGPVEVVDDHFRAVVMGARPVTAELDQGLVRDLQAMGAQVRLLSWGGASERFSQIADVAQLQIAAYRKAELNGVTPGEFRWCPQVTTSETGFGISA